MSDSSYSEVEQVGWFKRIVSSIGGVIIGIILFLVSFVVLFLNEKNAVETARKLHKGENEVISVPVDQLNPDNDGQLIHITGLASPNETLKDAQFGVAIKALRLKRIVEMYQWKEEAHTETRKKLGGGEERVTTYTYKKEWTTDAIDSTKFKKSGAPRNPGSKPFQDQTFKAVSVKLGAFDLPPSLCDRITGEESFSYTDELLAKLPADLRSNFQLRDGLLYRSTQPSEGDEPQVGDVRIEFRVVKPQNVSVVARQKNKMLSPDTGGVGELIRVGTYSASALFQEAKHELSVMTWILRLVGFVLMAIGIGLAFQPLVIFADFIPFLGNLVGLGVGVFALGVAFVLSMITIAVSWLTVRPLLGIGLLVAAGAVIALLMMMSRRKQAAIESK